MEEITKETLKLVTQAVQYVSSKVLLSKEDQEDVVQAVIFTLLKYRKQGKPIDNLNNWIYRVAYSRAIDWLRNKDYKHSTILSLDCEVEYFEEQLYVLDREISMIDSEVIIEQAYKIGGIGGICILQGWIIGKTVEEIGEDLIDLEVLPFDVTIAATKSYLFRFRSRMKMDSEIREILIPGVDLNVFKVGWRKKR